MRCVSTRVLPDPGPESTRTGPGGAVTAILCWGLSILRISPSLLLPYAGQRDGTAHSPPLYHIQDKCNATNCYLLPLTAAGRQYILTITIEQGLRGRVKVPIGGNNPRVHADEAGHDPVKFRGQIGRAHV